MGRSAIGVDTHPHRSNDPGAVVRTVQYIRTEYVCGTGVT